MERRFEDHQSRRLGISPVAKEPWGPVADMWIEVGRSAGINALVLGSSCWKIQHQEADEGYLDASRLFAKSVEWN